MMLLQNFQVNTKLTKLLLLLLCRGPLGEHQAQIPESSPQFHLRTTPKNWPIQIHTDVQLLSEECVLEYNVRLQIKVSEQITVGITGDQTPHITIPSGACELMGKIS
jgi:hypothetical protein